MAHAIITYNFPTRIHSGAGASQQLPRDLTKLGCTRPLFVTDSGLANLAVCQNYTGHLHKTYPELAMFNGISGNPVAAQVRAGVAAYKTAYGGAGADSLIAFGGGAAMDVAKSIGVLATHSGDLFDYEDIPGAKPIIDADLPPVIAIPTTAGTGSEVGRSAVVSTDDTHQKKIIFSPGMLPVLVYLDPELLLDLPASITAATGIDALTHSIEAYLVDMDHPMCDGIALESIHLIARSLKVAVHFAASGSKDKTSAHIEARQDMLNAAMMGAVAFQKGLGLNHSCAHALSTVNDLHHGLANAIMLPHCMRFNLSVCEAKFARMARVSGCGHSGAEFIKWLQELNSETGIPANLGAAGVKKDNLAQLVEIAMVDICHPSGPRPVTKSDFEFLFKAALN